MIHTFDYYATFALGGVPIIGLLKQIIMKAVKFALATLAAVLCFSVSQVSAQDLIIRGGTSIAFETVNPLSSRTAYTGGVVDLRVLSDVVVDGQVVINSGAIAKGTVVNASKATILGIGGSLTIEPVSVNAVDGTYIPLSGASRSAVGASKTVLAVVCGILSSGIGLIIPGEQAYIPAGTILNATVVTNTPVSVPGIAL